MSRKIIIETEHGPEVFEFIESSTVVGRGEDCELVLQGDRVSRRHCRFVHLADALMIEDLGSSNGTYVDGQRIEERRVLEPGNRIEIGGHVVWVDRMPRATAGSTAVSRDDEAAVFAPAGGPPPSRRQAGDRKARTNAVPIVVGFSALLLVIFFLKQPPAESPQNRTREEAATAREEKTPAGRKTGLSDEELAARRMPGAMSPEEQARIEARGRALEELSFDVDERLIQYDYAGALAALAAFEERHGKAGPSIPRKIEEAMKTASDQAIGEYQRLLGENREDLAIALLRERIERFPAGSAARSDIDRILARPAGLTPTVARGDSKPAPNGSGSVPAVAVREPVKTRRAADEAERDAARDAFFALGNEAEILLGQRRYDQAAARFREAAESGGAAGLEAGLLAPVLRKMRQAERLRDFVTTIEETARTSGESLGQVAFLSDRRGAVKGATDEGIIFEDDQGEMVISPRVLRSDAMKTMLQRAELDAVGRVNAATFLFTVGERELAEKLLHRAENEIAALKPEIDSILADAFAIDLPEGGFVWHDGHYLSPGDVTRVKVRETIDGATPNLQSSDAAKRELAYAVLRGLGDRAASAYHRALLDAKAALLARADKMGGVKKLAALDERRQTLETARASALELIFDEQKYPYPYRGVGPDILKMYQETQKEIDARTAVVKEIWDDTMAVKLTPEVREVVAMLAEYNRELDRLELGRGPADPRHLLHLPLGSAVGIRNYAWDEIERERVDVSAAWMADNETKTSKATAAERQQVRITNEYRLMMGRHAVKLNEKLLACARMHSEDMAKGGFFSHDNPLDPKKRTPSNRAQLVGFNGVGISENIAMNPGGAMGAHRAWIHSSGHHRNILSKAWRLLGSGNSGSLWTQNFSIREYGETESATGIKGGDGTPEAGLPGEDGVR